MNKQNRYKIIYLLGSAHCGSTLLEMLLGTQKEIFAAGELAFYSHYTKEIPHKKIDEKIGFTCTCKMQVRKCDFWSKVMRDADLKRPIIKNRGHLETYKIFFNILNPINKYFSFPIKLSQNKNLYDAVYKHAKRSKPELKYIVDSSKDPRRLYALLADKKIKKDDIYVIYLIRDGRAYLNSYKKDVETISGVKDRNMLITLIEWVAVQISARALIKKYGLKHIVVPYHRLSTSPDQTLKETLSLLNTKKNKSATKMLAKINRSEYHNLHGNFVKYKAFKKIKRDRSWRSGLNFVEKLLTTVLLYPLNRFWVFNNKRQLK